MPVGKKKKWHPVLAAPFSTANPNRIPSFEVSLGTQTDQIMDLWRGEAGQIYPFRAPEIPLSFTVSPTFHFYFYHWVKTIACGIWATHKHLP